MIDKLIFINAKKIALNYSDSMKETITGTRYKIDNLSWL